MPLIKISEKRKPLISLISVVLIVLSIVSIFLMQGSRTPPLKLEPFDALGMVAAEETSKLLGKQGQVALVTYDPASMPALKAELDSFTATLKKQGGITLMETEIVTSTQPAPAMEGDMEMIGSPISSALFLELLKKFSSASAIVFFADLPIPTDEELETITATPPKIILVCSDPFGPKKLMEIQLVQLAICPRVDDPSPSREDPQNLRDWFNRFYQIVTPEKAAALPD